MIVLFGGTGTLGHALAKIIDKTKQDCTIVSRCELRQKNMKKLYPNFKYVIGDITNDAWMPLVKSPTYVFNLAAMKHVDIAEDNVEHCMLTNYIGTINTAQWAMENHAESYIFSSTDKAVLPINLYGASKMAAEKYLKNMEGNYTNIAVFRWGNIVGSRGSVLHAFKESLENDGMVNITHEQMTRFWAHIDDVANFMWDCKDFATGEEPHIPPMKSAYVLSLAKCVAKYLGIESYNVKISGIRPGEKIHECLRSGHDFCIKSNDKHMLMDDDELFELVKRTLDV